MRITGNIVDIEKREIYGGTLVTEDGRIKEIIKDGRGYESFILPPFIDSHVHVESSMLVPTEFARLASVWGTGACVCDPHEIANVAGMDGVRFMLENAEKSPFRFFFGAPSCVPATPFETAGGVISNEDIKELFGDARIKFLSEMMNVSGVTENDETVKEKLRTAINFGRRIDGHAPLLRGEKLIKYAAAGITTDHEAVSREEAEEKISLGIKIQIREGSAARNFDALAPLLEKYPHMCMLCSDDMHPDSLARGHINLLVRRAAAMGIDVFKVLAAACITPVKHYGLDTGLLRQGDSADFIVVNNLRDFNVTKTCVMGITCAENGIPLLPNIRTERINRFGTQEKSPADFEYSPSGETFAITVTDGQLITGREKVCGADTDCDVLKIAVVNRYSDTMPSVAFIKNFGIKKGACASSVAHDSHNVVCIGCDDESMADAVNLVIRSKGGLSAVCGDEKMLLELPVGGLMTDADGYETAVRYAEIDRMVKKMGSPLAAPFMTMSFMSLLVIGSLKLSDKGLFDGESFSFVS